MIYKNNIILFLFFVRDYRELISIFIINTKLIKIVIILYNKNM